MPRKFFDPYNGLAQRQRRDRETLSQLLHILANRTCAERQSRCPTRSVGRTFSNMTGGCTLFSAFLKRARWYMYFFNSFGVISSCQNEVSFVIPLETAEISTT